MYVEFRFMNHLKLLTPPEAVEAKIITIPSRYNLDSLNAEEEDEEFEILWNENKGLWASFLNIGSLKLLLNVKAKGYAELN